jgi:hypothetical protein
MRAGPLFGGTGGAFTRFRCSRSGAISPRLVRPGTALPSENLAGGAAAALRLSNGLTANLWDHSEARQMKFIIATFSLLVLLALSGSMVALLVGVSGYLPDVGAGTQAASAKSTSRLR